VVTYYFDTGTRFAPYAEAGLGMLYTDLRGYTLGGHFSFMEEVGLGGVYFLDKNLVFSASWRYRHISNAYLYEHNAGLDSWMVLAGFSYFRLLAKVTFKVKPLILRRQFEIKTSINVGACLRLASHVEYFQGPENRKVALRDGKSEPKLNDNLNSSATPEPQRTICSSAKNINR
jgi:hypothetical protein